ncbi:MAG: hypothetical protein M3326_13205, partial [Actinomycetota bacterium]|nr:hypothetical protein [Actinomycetota bacterium]
MPVLPAYLVRGDQPVLLADAVKHLVAELADGGDARLLTEELAGDEYTVGAVVDAAQTPPFFGDRRIVVARDVGRFSTHDVEPLVAYLQDPLPTTSLVLVAGGGQVARPLVDAVRKAGHVVDAGVPGGQPRRPAPAPRDPGVDHVPRLADGLDQRPRHLAASGHQHERRGGQR